MGGVGREKSLLDYLGEVPEPRRREGRLYGLARILGIRILAALEGEMSAPGMWMWAKAREAELGNIETLGCWGAGRLPSLSAIGYATRAFGSS